MSGKTGTTMDAIIMRKGGAQEPKARNKIRIPGGAIPPRPAPGPEPEPAATPDGPLQARNSRRDGRTARRAERENGPAAPEGGSVRDKEKP